MLYCSVIRSPRIYNSNVSSLATNERNNKKKRKKKRNQPRLFTGGLMQFNRIEMTVEGAEADSFNLPSEARKESRAKRGLT